MLFRILVAAATLTLTGTHAFVPITLRSASPTSLRAICSASPTALRAMDDAASRREFSTIAASALVGMTLQPLPAFAANQKGCLPGTNPASGYTVGVFEHATPNFKKWHKVIDGFGKDFPFSVIPPECKAIREVFVKTKTPEGGDSIMAFLVFENSGLKAVTDFFDEKKSPIITQGRKEGWITGKWHANYYTPSHFRGKEIGPPPPLKKGNGVIYGGHGYAGKFQEWADLFGAPDFDKFHNSFNIFASAGGPSIGKISNDVTEKSGIGVLHFTDSFADAKRFEAEFSKLWPTLDKKKFTDLYRLTVGEVMYASDDFIKAGIKV